mmetsp:Transcript_27254/g.41737  ORF Transcript_27254/g.41737 Transcript_27254/m.41737 type:complete len:574 (-) Transcript_27254:969-2690(-)|eukprot:CAMPEP_0195309246 /NCGR_PEP_ID=MMETSP0707-20130614/38641_1 /TAXON_ID=33640 /ORGANISM="Asterionellopsis glacialis, Strain CCMP134" /LENGTH=573 /DNA_ID=CAMNT_0040373543 /DNA_START=23 /DNA_END=1744 /DNA_ORIENTATION=+
MKISSALSFVTISSLAVSLDGFLFVPSGLQQLQVKSSITSSSGRQRQYQLHHNDASSALSMAMNNEEQELAAIEEEARLKVLESRRNTIRSTLKGAESVKNFRISSGYVPELDEEGNPIKSDSKAAITITAFVVAAGAVALRVGGRAALVSAVGLDFANENPELKAQLDNLLATADSFDPVGKAALFIGAWTAVKVFCFDAGGIVLALSAGLLFGGVLQGAFFSALAATIGSSVAFALAKADTPVRAKALDVVEQYPSLRGIEKVVARDGLKAILTLRLAPVLPIPVGMYNYVYGVTNVPYFDFAGGIFLGSLKPYLLDSYLGYFGKEVVDGSMGDASSTQDIVLLAALGVSVMIGVFASQLAGETWDTVLKEVEAEKKEKEELEGVEEEKELEDGVLRKIAGFELPLWVVGFQIALGDASERVEDMVEAEWDAKVWNYTKAEGGPPKNVDPAFASGSPEMLEVGKGFDFGAANCEGLVLSPALFSAFLKYADPLYDEQKDMEERQTRKKKRQERALALGMSGRAPDETEIVVEELSSLRILTKEEELLEKLSDMRLRTQQRLDQLDEKLKVD